MAFGIDRSICELLVLCIRNGIAILRYIIWIVAVIQHCKKASLPCKFYYNSPQTN
jgi:hypothetical protein